MITRSLALLIVGLSIYPTAAQEIIYLPDITDADIANRTIDTSKPVGTLSAAHGVGSTGAATFSIPIAAPKGVNGLEPAITLNYNSQGGDGHLGMGWAIGGAYSAITRVGKDHYHDEITLPIRFSALDEFALDGVRLVLVDGIHGQVGASYDTDAASWTNVRLAALNSNGEPDHFQMMDKSGKRYYYGIATSAENSGKVMISGRTLSWLLTRVVDPFGNEMTYTYAYDNSDIRIKRIDYADAAYIDFTYKIRADRNENFVRGSGTFMTLYLLETITSGFRDHEPNEYSIRYSQRGLGASYVNRITTSRGEDELNQTIFKYNDQSESFLQTTSFDAVAGISIDIFPGDFDGNGRTDLLVARWQYEPPSYFKKHLDYKIYFNGSYEAAYEASLPSGSVGQIVAHRQNISGATSVSTGGQRRLNERSLLFGDYNGDGRDDIAIFFLNSGEFCGMNKFKYEQQKLFISNFENGQGDFTEYDIGTPNINTLNTFSLDNGRIRDFIMNGDFTGDGRDDIVFIGHDECWNILQMFLWSYNVGWAGQTIPIDLANFISHSKRLLPVNIDGDGKLDIMAQSNGSGAVCRIMTMNGSNMWVGTGNNLWLGYQEVQDHDEFEIGVADFNGDGITDVISRDSNSNLYICMGNGQNYEPHHMVGLPNGPYLPNISRVVIADFNGDGRSDIFHAKNANIYIGYSRGHYGSVQFTWELFTSPNPVTSVYVADYDNDGQIDILNRHVYWAPVDIMRFTPRSRFSALLNKIQDGFLNTIEFNYSLAMDFDNYTQTNNVFQYPGQSSHPNIPLVQRVFEPNGIGGVRLKSYSYRDGFGLRNGPGFLGFIGENLFNNCVNRSVDIMKSTCDYRVLVPRQRRVFLASNDQLLEVNDTESTTSPVGSGAGQRFTWYVANQVHTDELSGMTILTSLDMDVANGNILERTVEMVGIKKEVDRYSYIWAGPWMDSNEQIPGYLNAVSIHEIEVERMGEEVVTVRNEMDYDVSIGNYNGTGALVQRRNNVYSERVIYHDIIARTQHGNIGHEMEYYTNQPEEEISMKYYYYDDAGRFLTTLQRRLTLGGTGTEVWTEEKFQNEPVLGSLVQYDGRDGLRIKYDYNAFGQLLKEYAPHLPDELRYYTTHTRSWNFDEVGSVYSVLSEPGGMPRTITLYDAFGREIHTRVEGFEAGTWRNVSTAYDQYKRVSYESDEYLIGMEQPEGATLTYDDLGRVIEKAHSIHGSTTTSYEYIDQQLITVSTDALGRTHTTYTDPTGSIVKAEDHGGVLTYRYDSRDQPLEIKLNGALVNSITYDDHGSRTGLWDRAAGQNNYDYDPFEKLKWHENPDGAEKFIYYDSFGRVYKTEENEGAIEILYYSNGDRHSDDIVHVTGFGSARTFEYDPLLRLDLRYLESPEMSSLQRTYTYDYYDRLDLSEYLEGMSGIVLQHGYTSTGYLKIIRDWEGYVYFDALDMDGRGRYTKYKQVDDLVTSVTYDGPFPIEFKANGAQHLQLKWDPLSGNLTQREDLIAARREKFEYDELDRLTFARVIDVELEEEIFVGQMSYHNDGSNTGRTQQKYDVGLYDGSGHRVDAIAHNGFPDPPTTPPTGISLETQVINYTSFHQPAYISEVVNGTLMQVEFWYGPEHQRVFSRLVDVEERLYDGEYEIRKDLTTGDWEQIIYVNGGNGLCAIVVLSDEINRYAVYKDHLGSILTVTKSVPGEQEPVVIARQNFDAWGRDRNADTWLHEESFDLPAWLYRGYTGHEHVRQFELINMNGRMYDPVVGQMLSPDNFNVNTTSTLSFNRYNYVQCNPMKYTDPTGEIIWFVAAGALVGGYLGGAIAAGDGGIDNARWNPFSKGQGWNNTDWWKGAIVGSLMGAGAGLAVGAVAGGAATTASLNTFLSTSGGKFIIHGLVSSNANILSTPLRGEDYRNWNGWSSALMAFGTGGFMGISPFEQVPTQMIGGGAFGFGDRMVSLSRRGISGMELIGYSLLGLAEGGIAGFHSGQLGVNHSISALSQIGITSSVTSLPGLAESVGDFYLTVFTLCTWNIFDVREWYFRNTNRYDRVLTIDEIVNLVLNN